MHVRRLVAVMLALMCAVDAAAQEASRIPAGTASMAGRVTERESRRPLEQVIVRISSPDGRRAMAALSGGDGQYLFEAIAAGEYRVTAALSGFVSQRYGSGHDEVVRVEAGQAKRLLDLSLPRGGSIAGHVRDSQGRPLKGAIVSALLIDDPVAFRIAGIVNRSGAQGEYTVEDLPPGNYYITARWADSDLKWTSVAPESGYYPSASRSADATAVRLPSGETVRNIDVMLPTRLRHRVTGHFVRGVGGCSVEANLLSKGRSVRSINVAADGAFEAGHIDPGLYTIWARCHGEGTSEVAVMTLQVDSDLLDLTLPLLATGRVTGRIVTADGGALPEGPLYLNAILAAGGQEIDPLPRDRVEVAADGSFDLSGVLGERKLAVTGLDPTWVIDHIRHGRSPVQSLTIQPGAELHEITVVLGRR